jgi:hypothetical protein
VARAGAAVGVGGDTSGGRAIGGGSGSGGSGAIGGGGYIGGGGACGAAVEREVVPRARRYDDIVYIGQEAVELPPVHEHHISRPEEALVSSK